MALDRARSEPLEVIEIAGILAGLFVATTFTRYGLKDTFVIDRIASVALNFAAALPLLVVLAGPFLVRRTRRGLRTFIGEQERHG